MRGKHGLPATTSPPRRRRDGRRYVEDHQRPFPLSVLFFQQSGGADLRRGDTAYAHRDVLCNLILLAEWRDPGESERHVRWTRELWQALRPYGTGGVYVNNIGREEEDGADQVRAAYGANYQRLAELKRE